MDELFLAILNMSITGAFVIAAICLARLPLKKAPKVISYCLWAVVGFRLFFPLSLESVFSLIPWGAQPIPETELLSECVSFGSAASAALRAIGDAANGGLGTVTVYLGSTADGYPITTPAYHSQVWLLFLPYIWVAGSAVMLIYGIVSYALLKRKMCSAIRVENGVCESDTVQSPFVLGILKPKIYIPLGLSVGELEYILLHERTHIRRRDPIVKLAAYFILCLHWFNPLVWVAFWLCGVDMEMSCDERVLREMGIETKKDYSLSLLSFAVKRRTIGSSPLAFSEGGLKQRIKNILNFKKPSRAIIVAAVMLAAVLSIGFAVNRASGRELVLKDLELNFTNAEANSADTPTNDIASNVNHLELADTIRNVLTPLVGQGNCEVTVNLDNETLVADIAIRADNIGTLSQELIGSYTQLVENILADSGDSIIVNISENKQQGTVG